MTVRNNILLGDAYWDFEAYRGSLLSLIASNYDEPGTSSGYNNSLPTMDVSGGTDFYNQRSEKIQKLLDDPSNEMTQAQKNYWQVHEPPGLKHLLNMHTMKGGPR